MTSFFEATQDTFFLPKSSINCQGILLNFDQPRIMGILNLTPDSFHDGGKYINEEAMLIHAGKMVDAGVDIIDAGGQSTRPGASMITLEDELKRVIPAIKCLRNHFKDIPISIDTFHSQVAEESINAGASIINDVSGGEMDHKMFDCLADLQVPYVLTHIKGDPETMQYKANYKNLMQEILEYFSEKMEKLQRMGINDIIIDPGFGFGKTLEHNYELISKLDELSILGAPVLVGVSRKSMIQKVLDVGSQEALNGSSILHTLALEKGADILRVHDVLEAKQVIAICDKVKQYKRNFQSSN